MAAKKSSPAKKEIEKKEELASIQVQKEQVQGVKTELEPLSRELITTTKSINDQSEYNDLKKSIIQLSNSVETLKQSSRMIYSAPESKNEDCGCTKKNGCSDEKQCCVQLFISRVRIIKAQKIIEPGDMDKLELIFAVRALDMCGLLPSLTSYLTIDKDSGWVPAYSPIGKFCIPCNGKMTIPLIAEARETGDRTELLPEYGSSSGSITLSCDCEIIPTQIPIHLSGGGKAGGQVEVEVTARKINGGCC